MVDETVKNPPIPQDKPPTPESIEDHQRGVTPPQMTFGSEEQDMSSSTTSALAQEVVRANNTGKEVNMKNGFDAPIPGQSLTKPVKGSALENPPTFTDPESTAERIFSNITSTKQAAKIFATLEGGATSESIATAMLHSGVATGKWTPDMAMMLTRPVTAMITAMAVRQGLEGFEVLNPDSKDNEFFSRAKKLKDAKQAVPTRSSSAKLDKDGNEEPRKEFQFFGMEE